MGRSENQRVFCSLRTYFGWPPRLPKTRATKSATLTNQSPRVASTHPPRFSRSLAEAAAAQRSMPEPVTELEFPFTPAGHRRLLARCNHYRNCMRFAWANFYEEVRRSHEQWSEIRAATHALGQATAGTSATTLEETLKKTQQLIQELGRKCECPVCYRTVLAAEMNAQHPQYMKILHCGHILCGGCAFTIRQTEAPKCPICRLDIASQLATTEAPREDAVSQLRPKRDADDLQVVAPTAAPAGAFPTQYRGQCYVCDIPWAAGSTVIKHRRLPTKIVCEGCVEAAMPCTE